MPNESTTKCDQVADENRAAVRSLFERVYSKGELNLIDDVVTSDFIAESTESSHAYLGPGGMRAHVIRLRAAFRGFTIGIDDLHVQGDTFEVSWTARGTHERRFRGVDPVCDLGRVGEEPRGNRLAVSGDTRGTVRNGKIHESRMVWDAEELRHQLGVSVEDAETDTGAGGWAGRNPSLLEGAAGAEISTLPANSVSGCR